VLTWLTASWLACVLLVDLLPARVCLFLLSRVMTSSLIKEFHPAYQHCVITHTTTPATLRLSPAPVYALKRCEGSKRVYQVDETETSLVAGGGIAVDGLSYLVLVRARPRDRRKMRFGGPHA
jgi:hypothetical protein